MIKRNLEKSIIKESKYYPVIAILGPRQSGKTTLARALFKNHTYLTLEDLDIRAAARHDPRTFLITNRNDHGIIIDEFQYVPELLSYIQTIVDQEQKPGYFILTGSQNFLMNEAITQSLAGRVSINTLLPLSINELTTSKLLPLEIEEMLYKGCYPAIYSKNIPPQSLYKNYMQTYIERDVRQLTQIGNLTLFQTFITLCAARVGQLLNLSSLANDCGISDNTAKRWLTILEASYIIFLLQPYHKNFGKRLVKRPKIFFHDTGLACYLLKIKENELATHPNRENLFESLIISNILKRYYNQNQVPTIYFWQDKIGREIDCIIQDGQKLIPIEIKASRTIGSRFFENLKHWNKLTQTDAPQFVVYGGSQEQTRTHINLISWQNMDKIFNES